jgi:hypothetical protein
MAARLAEYGTTDIPGKNSTLSDSGVLRDGNKDGQC